MFRSYLKTAWRSLWKHKGHTAVNLVGFAMGMACCVVILVYVRHERSFDDYHKDIDRVFRISMDIRTKTANRLFAPISDTAGLGRGLCLGNCAGCVHRDGFLSARPLKERERLSPGP